MDYIDPDSTLFLSIGCKLAYQVSQPEINVLSKISYILQQIGVGTIKYLKTYFLLLPIQVINIILFYLLIEVYSTLFKY